MACFCVCVFQCPGWKVPGVFSHSREVNTPHLNGKGGIVCECSDVCARGEKGTGKKCVVCATFKEGVVFRCSQGIERLWKNDVPSTFLKDKYVDGLFEGEGEGAVDGLVFWKGHLQLNWRPAVFRNYIVVVSLEGTPFIYCLCLATIFVPLAL